MRAERTEDAAGLDGLSTHKISSIRPGRDRPWLLPTNRKLRHLQGLSLRNLTFAAPASRSRGATDDEVLSQTWKTPAKLLALRETPKLEHSKSSNDLVISGTPERREWKENGDGGSPKRPRPSPGKLRRRSTLNWTGASPDARQKRLEEVIGERMADTWFSLHAGDDKDPIYVSEVAPQAMNPNFQYFDLNSYGPLVSRLDEITVRFWAKNASHKEYMLLIELDLNLRSLQFIGKSLENFHHPLPSNCIVFYLTDGVYTNFTDMPPEESLMLTSLAPPKAIADDFTPSSSYDALMRLSTLDDCIQDALATRGRIASQIEQILHAHAPALDLRDRAARAQDSLAAKIRAVAAARKQLKAASSRRAALASSLDARLTAMRAGRVAQSRALEHLDAAAGKLAACSATLGETAKGLRGQRRRICRDLLRIFPIEPIPDLPLSFAICGLPLPNSSFDSTTDDAVTAAALGYAAHLVSLLSLYLSTPLPYPLTPRGSTSTAHDPISIFPSQGTSISASTSSFPASTSPSRSFPLYSSSVPHYRFAYAVFLLNKDIERLLVIPARLPAVLDLRNTLPNLKLLAEVVAGDGDGMPARKRGLVEGLLHAESE
ncbi:MAG: hypothetical protein M1832_002411 [Thelocarpon impressellum]|nr:MAG: hypothetical protein M1832_002411 [Thelocarpon impressellum]